MNETEGQIRLRRAKGALDYARERQAEAIRALAAANEAVKPAKARYEDLFMAEERAEATRREGTS